MGAGARLGLLVGALLGTGTQVRAAPALEGLELRPPSGRRSNLRLFECQLDRPSVSALFARPALAGTRELVLQFVRLDRRGAEALVASPVGQNLEQLWLQSVQLEPGVISVLLRLPRLRGLKLDEGSPVRELMGANGLGREAPLGVSLMLDGVSQPQLRALARTSGQALRLSVHASAAQLRLLERTRALAMVEDLRVDCADRCVQALAASGQLEALERLVVSCIDDGPITAATGRALARAHLPHLRALSFEMDHEFCYSEQPRGIGAAGVRAIVAAPWATSLEELHLLMQGIGDAGLRALARAPTLARLRALSVVGDPAGASAVRALVSQSAFAAGLERLHLGGEEIDGGPSTLDAAGLVALARSARLPALRELDLQLTRTEDAAAWKALADAPWMKRVHLAGDRDQPRPRPDDDRSVTCSGPRFWTSLPPRPAPP